MTVPGLGPPGLLGLPVRWPVIGAPMAGGPSTPALAAAVSGAGGLGFLAAGYLNAETVQRQVAEVRSLTGAPFGVNLFVPQRAEVDEAAVAAYLATLRPAARALGVSLDPAWDDDAWDEKVEALMADPVPVVSFTFGCPDPAVVAGFHQVGSAVVVTVTTPAEALAAAEAGADAVCAQGVEAGGHQGSFGDAVAPDTAWGVLALLTAVRRRVQVPPSWERPSSAAPRAGPTRCTRRPWPTRRSPGPP